MTRPHYSWPAPINGAPHSYAGPQEEPLELYDDLFPRTVMCWSRNGSELCLYDRRAQRQGEPTPAIRPRLLLSMTDIMSASDLREIAKAALRYADQMEGME